MSKSANVFARIDPDIKIQAENILKQLGIPMSTAIEIYLRQIVLQRKIPFEMKLLEDIKPIAFESLDRDGFIKLMNEALKSINDGSYSDINDFKKEFEQEIKL